MKQRVTTMLLLFISLLTTLSAQHKVEFEQENNHQLTVMVTLYGNISKKEVCQKAELETIRQLLYSGVAGSSVSEPLLGSEEKSLSKEHKNELKKVLDEKYGRYHSYTSYSTVQEKGKDKVLKLDYYKVRVGVNLEQMRADLQELGLLNKVDKAVAEIDVKPSIMIIPYVPVGGDVLAAIETDELMRSVLNNLREVFDRRGYNTLDYQALMRRLQTEGVLQGNNQQDAKTAVLNNSGADICMEVEVTTYPSAQRENYLRIRLAAWHRATAETWADDELYSAKNESSDFQAHARAVLEGAKAQAIFDLLKRKLSTTAAEGNSVRLVIGIDEASAFTFSTEIDDEGMQLSDAVELWVSDNAYQNNYKLSGMTDKQMNFEYVKIPLQAANGQPMNANKFSFEVLKFFRKLGITIQRDVDGNTIHIHIK